MSKISKALERLQGRPKDLTWDEVVYIFKHFGYDEKKGKGSRRKFFNSKTKAFLALHEPHPARILKSYAVKLIMGHLEENELL